MGPCLLIQARVLTDVLTKRLQVGNKSRMAEDRQEQSSNIHFTFLLMYGY